MLTPYLSVVKIVKIVKEFILWIWINEIWALIAHINQHKNGFGRPSFHTCPERWTRFERQKQMVRALQNLLFNNKHGWKLWLTPPPTSLTLFSFSVWRTCCSSVTRLWPRWGAAAGPWIPWWRSTWPASSETEDWNIFICRLLSFDLINSLNKATLLYFPIIT